MMKVDRGRKANHLRYLNLSGNGGDFGDAKFADNQAVNRSGEVSWPFAKGHTPLLTIVFATATAGYFQGPSFEMLKKD